MTYARPSERNLETEAKTVIANVADKAGQMASKAGQKVGEAFESAEDAVASAAQHGREATERVSEVGGNFKKALDRSVKEQPTATLFIAAALGFVVGAIWKS